MAVKPIDMAIAIFIELLLSMQLQLLMSMENYYWEEVIKMLCT
jgi:hypothetical protein